MTTRSNGHLLWRMKNSHYCTDSYAATAVTIVTAVTTVTAVTAVTIVIIVTIVATAFLPPDPYISKESQNFRLLHPTRRFQQSQIICLLW